MIKPIKNLAQLVGRSDEQEVVAESNMGDAGDPSITSEQKASIHAVENPTHLDIVVGKESLRPYLILSVDIAFDITEDSAGVWYVAAPTEEEALAAFTAQFEEGVVPVRILSVDKVRKFADEVESALIARCAGRKE